MKNLCLLMAFGFLFTTTTSAQQTMDIHNLLNRLQNFWVILEDLQADVKEKGELSLTHSYSIIHLSMTKADNYLLRAELRLQGNGTFKLYDFYGQEDMATEDLKLKLLNRLEQINWNEEQSTIFPATQELRNYFDIAERIFSKGDDIRNMHHYTTVVISKDLIQLEQVNRRNSRSLNHRDNYYLRDLKVVIPRTAAGIELEMEPLNNEWIGEMSIEFSDASSSGNRTVGKAIRKQIDQEISNFKQ